MLKSPAFRTLRLLFLLVLVCSALLAACGSDDDKDKDKALTPVSIQFSWVHTMEFAGFYAADERDLYQDAGLDVTMHGGGFDAGGNYIDPVQQVLSGEAEFGVTDGGNLLQARAAGHPLVAIGTIYQNSPVVLLSLADTGITRPDDLIGKRIYTDDTNVAVPYRAFLASQDISLDDVIEVPKTTFTLDPLFDGEVDVVVCFITNEVVQARESGADVNVLIPSDFGIEIYPNVIFTTEDRITNNPELVAAFLKTSVEGIGWAAQNPAASTKIVLDRYGEDMTEELRAVQEPGMTVSSPLLLPLGSEPGMMIDDAWAFTHETLLAQGILDAPIDYSAAYTLDFLDAIYGEN